MDILLCYFSATGNTSTIAEFIYERLTESGASVEKYDATRPAARKTPLDLSSYQGVVFGSPIHSMRAPRIFREWLATLDGGGKPCAMFFTYGGFQVHPTHFTTRQILEKQGFKVIASAEFLGRHTYNLGGWDSMTERPDDSDFEVAGQFAELVYNRFLGKDSGVVGELDPGPYTEEQLDMFESFRFKMLTQTPTRDGGDCSMCMLCEELCPTGAIEAEVGNANKDLCIACLRCVQNCPDDALKINDLTEFFHMKMQMDQETPESLTAKKSKIYS